MRLTEVPAEPAKLRATKVASGDLSIDDAIVSLAKRKQENQVSLGHDDGYGTKTRSAKK